MQRNRRQNRTPFSATSYGRLNDADGNQIAICMTPGIAHFLKVAANSFDALTEALDLCRGELQLDDSFQSHPGYQRLLKLRERVEQELRGHHN